VGMNSSLPHIRLHASSFYEQQAAYTKQGGAKAALTLLLFDIASANCTGFHVCNALRVLLLVKRVRRT
jgi:hypothetical protein